MFECIFFLAFITIADDIFCNNFLHFGYKKTVKSNKTLKNKIILRERSSSFVESLTQGRVFCVVVLEQDT